MPPHCRAGPRQRALHLAHRHQLPGSRAHGTQLLLGPSVATAEGNKPATGTEMLGTQIHYRLLFSMWQRRV
jgi:hypothetical protein